MYAFKKALERDTKVQHFTVPADALPVNFLNRGGEPTVYFATAFEPQRGTSKEAPQEVKRPIALVLTNGEGSTPPGKWEYIGTAEFSGGQVLFHAWMNANG